MTRKDYILMAAALREGYEKVAATDDFSIITGYSEACDVLALALKRDNPRFDHDRFAAAIVPVEG